MVDYLIDDSRTPAASFVGSSIALLSIAVLATQFPEPAARALDALVEGWWISQSWHSDPLETERVRRAVSGVLCAFDSDAATSS